MHGVLKVRELLKYSTVREALLYEKLEGDKVRCGLCERRCLISLGLKGFCKTRMNVDGKLYTLVYGDLSAVESRPIEIKPFFHYWPGSTALTFSTWSCNFNCVWCQNHHLSKTEPSPTRSSFHSAEEIVEAAVRMEDNGLCASFQEPTILTDWVLPAFRVAREKGLYCCYVSNGYMTLEALRLLREAGMDGLKIDLKGDTETYLEYCGGADVEKVWRNAGEAKKLGFHVEIVNLVVTDVNDDEDCLRGVIERHLETMAKVGTLEKAYEMAKEMGVLFPYLGNVQGHGYEDTYCPSCGERLIHRFGYRIVRYRITDDKKCVRCGRSIPVTGRYVKRRHGFLF